MKKLGLVFLFCLLCKNSLAMVFPFLKVDCYSELDTFEVRLLKFDWIPDKGTFFDKVVSLESPEYELLKNKYDIIQEYHAYRNEPLKAKVNYMAKECVIGEDKYIIHIDDMGTTISKGDVILAKELFFSSALNDWNIQHLIYNAKRQEFLVSGKFTYELPVLHFLFSTKNGAMLDENVIKAKGKELEKEVLVAKDAENADENGKLYRLAPSFLPMVIDVEDSRFEE